MRTLFLTSLMIAVLAITTPASTGNLPNTLAAAKDIGGVILTAKVDIGGVTV